MIEMLSEEFYQESEPITHDEILKLYQDAFSFLNNELFDGELPPIYIDYAPAEIMRNILSAAACFCVTKNDVPFILLNFERPAEYGLNGDDINELAHELIHYYCYLKNISDCSRKNYHNKQFKLAAENHGLKVGERNTSYGFNSTTLPHDIIKNGMMMIRNIRYMT